MLDQLRGPAAARFDCAIMAQSQQTALCNAADSVEVRVCRLLLEVHDRGDSSRGFL